MKVLLPILAAAAVAGLALFRPAGVAPRSAGTWTAATLSPREPGRTTPPPQPLVYVVGAVVRPGVYRVAPDARVADAIARAGGTRRDADPIAVNLAAHLRDGDEIVVPVRGAEPAPRSGGSRAGRGSREKRGAGASNGRRAGHKRTSPGARADRASWRNAAPPPAPVDVNTADAPTLATVPGIGPGLALRIVAFRETNGPFASTDELLDVSGITDRRLDAMLPYLVAR